MNVKVLRLSSIIVAVWVFMSPLTTFAQWIEPDSLTSISQIKQNFSNASDTDTTQESVKIAGIASVESGMLHETYLQTYVQTDTSGISIFGYDIGEPITVGDSIVVKGVKQYYFGQPELLVNEYRVYPAKQNRLEPVELFQAFQNPRTYQAMLAKGTGIIREKGNRFNGKYLMIAPSDTTSETVMVYVSNFHARYQDFNFETPGIGDAVTVTGVIGQYDPAAPGSTTYKLFLRTPDDFSYASWPRYYYEVLAAVLLALAIIAGIWMISLRTQVKRKTRELEQSLEEKDLLIKEIHHRVKNNMAAISGLLELQSGQSDSQEVHNALQESQSRINSMMMVHEKLYQSLSFKYIQMQPYLQELADSIHKSFSKRTAAVQVHVDAEGVEMNTDQVIPMGLLVNELLVNAFKHAFEGKEEGQIWISLQENNQTATLRVEDNGRGLPGEDELHKSGSLGMLLIDAFSEQLQAEKTMKNNPGACFIFKFPIKPA